MLDVEDWAEIRRLHRAEQMPIRAIARHLGISRNTVRRALNSEAAPEGSIVDAVEPQIRELLQRFPEMPATVIAERIGWSRSYAVVRRRVRELRPVHQAADPVSRTGDEPGEVAQCELWFPPAEIPLGFGQTASPVRDQDARDELVVAGRVVQRISEQGFGDYLSLAPPAPEVQVGGRSVLLIPARTAGIDPDVLPKDYQRLVAIAREAAAPVTVRAVGEVLGLPVEVRGKLEPLWAKLNRMTDHFHKL